MPLDFNRGTAASCIKTAVVGNRGGRRGDGYFNNILAGFLFDGYIRRNAQNVFGFIGDVVKIASCVFHTHRVAFIVNADKELSAAGVGKSANGFQTVIIPGLFVFFVLIFTLTHNNGPQSSLAKPHQAEHAQLFLAGLTKILIVNLAG